MNAWKPALIFCEDTLKAIEALPLKEFFLRKERPNIRLIDEQLPLAVFLQNLRCPGLEVFCDYHSEGKTDATINLRGYHVDQGSWNEEYPVEVTSAHGLGDYLIRKNLGTNGYSAGHPKRVEGKIVQTMESISIDEVDAMRLEQVNLTIENKVQKKENGQYPENSILVVGLFLDRELLPFEFFELSRKVKSPSTFSKVFLVEPFRNLMVELSPTQIISDAKVD